MKFSNPLKNLIIVSDEVQEAIRHKRAVVALESTIITHGMPYPQNLETALKVEKLVRDQGAIPATIAILEGKIYIGLSSSRLEQLAQTSKAIKASSRTLSQLLVNKEDGATTVAGTIFVASLCNIPFMVTGGIGGVHRGAENTFDISADLTQLAEVPVTVICAGAKAILDLDKTLEYLETLMVPVVGYKHSEFPAFYTRSSGLPLETHFDSLPLLAQFLQYHWCLHPQKGVVIGNPVPQEAAMPEDEINEAIQKALSECEKMGIRGKPVTPFLLDRIQKITAGRSLKTNMALIENNAVVGGQLAVEYASLMEKER